MPGSLGAAGKQCTPVCSYGLPGLLYSMPRLCRPNASRSLLFLVAGFLSLSTSQFSVAELKIESPFSLPGDKIVQSSRDVPDRSAQAAGPPLPANTGETVRKQGEGGSEGGANVFVGVSGCRISLLFSSTGSLLELRQRWRRRRDTRDRSGCDCAVTRLRTGCFRRGINRFTPGP